MRCHGLHIHGDLKSPAFLARFLLKRHGECHGVFFAHNKRLGGKKIGGNHRMTIALQCNQISKVFYEKDETRAAGTPFSFRRLFRSERVPVYAVRETSFTVEKEKSSGFLVRMDLGSRH